MDIRLGQTQPMKTLIIDDEIDVATADGRALRNLVTELNKLEIEVIKSGDCKDGEAAIISDPSIDCVLIDWDLDSDKREARKQTLGLLKLVRAHNEKMPVFLITEHSELSAIPLDIIDKVDDFILILEDTADFIAGRICAAIKRYRDQLLPPFFAALVKFAQTYEYSWHTPGHTGGVAFLKSPVGQAFFNFFGENMLRSDLSISVGELGSLLDHSGPIGDGERYAARVFGANRTYSVTNGTSTSNRIVFTASVTQDDIVLCDRNCHKSIEHSLTMTGALPAYLIPSRNRYGIIGPIHPDKITPAAIKSLIKNNALIKSANGKKPVHSVITNSTYDGLCYNVKHVAELLGQSVDRIHFDEAWYGYARFNRLYNDRYAMHGTPANYKGPTLFATQSTHKLLAALSQASFIHVRDGRNPIEHERFNEAFMMHSSTSPQYAIIASNDVAAGMMDGTAGHTLTSESIKEAIAFRKTMARLRKELAQKKEWFFNVWQPEVVYDGKDKKRVPFEEAPDHLLCSEPNCWVLHPVDKWHGFNELQNSYCMLDPIKVTVLTPGVAADGSLEKFAIPAMLVTAYLDREGIVVEKTGDFSVLFLFSMGVTKGKWGTLITALLDFKKGYDANRPLAEALPSLVEEHPGRYDGMGLKDLADEMMNQIRKGNNTRLLAAAFSQLPKPEMAPQKAYRCLVRDQVQQVGLDRIANRTVATGIVPYPPGIPMLMPGENIGGEKGPFLSYLKALQAFDARFPGFGHDIHGVENVDGKYMIYCVREVSKK